MLVSPEKSLFPEKYTFPDKIFCRYYTRKSAVFQSISASSSNSKFPYTVQVVTGVEGTCQIKCSFNGNGLGGQQVRVSVGTENIIGEHQYDSVILDSNGQGMLKMPVLHNAVNCWIKIELIDPAQTQPGR